MIKSVYDLLDEKNVTWVLCGKGPSLNVARLSAPPPHWRVMGVSGTCEVIPTHLNLYTDIEAFLRKPIGRCCLPWRPNLHCKPNVTLPELVEKYPEFRAAEREGRLYGYRRKQTDNKGAPGNWLIGSAVFFSGEAAVSLCLAAGHKIIYTNGIDGGTDYHPAFDQASRLANGQSTFSKSHPQIKAMCLKSGAKWIRRLPPVGDSS